MAATSSSQLDPLWVGDDFTSESTEPEKKPIFGLPEGYANSTGCLDEVAKIMECKEKFQVLEWPVLYRIPASDVSNQMVERSDEKSKSEPKLLGIICGYTEAETYESAKASFSEKLKNSPEYEFVDKITKEPLKLGFGVSKLPVTFYSPIQSNQVDKEHNYLQKVFINYRGEELGHNFVSHLVDAFERYNINYFLDRNELRGKDLKNLFVRIKQSSIALVIFSPRYTESSWCLDELVKIKELADKKKLQVVPIFYKVEPEDVSKQKGEFGDNFWTLVRNSPSSSDHLKNWKEALICISKKMGLSLRDKSSECDFVKEIVTELRRVMETMGLEEGEYHYELPDFKKSKTRHF